MSRLVDADALIEMIDQDIMMTENFINKIGIPSEKALKHYAELVSQLNTLKSYKGIIQQQPTAYDVEKVVAELEYEAKLQDYLRENASARCNIAQAHIHRYAEQCYRNKAIDIVRKGGAT